MRVQSFDVIVGPEPRVLILGSMPGVRSLRAQEYYAHPRNVFWRTLGDLGCCDPATDYAVRIESLKEMGIALWDVLAACSREGSLDSSIASDTEVPNNIAGLLSAHPSIAAILFNGGKAEQAFRSHVLPGLPATRLANIALHRLPSTSPAHAIPYPKKLAAWQVILAFLSEN